MLLASLSDGIIRNPKLFRHMSHCFGFQRANTTSGLNGGATIYKTQLLLESGNNVTIPVRFEKVVKMFNLEKKDKKNE